MNNHKTLQVLLTSAFYLSTSQALWAQTETDTQRFQTQYLLAATHDTQTIASEQVLFLGSPLSLPQAAPLQNRPLQAAGWNLLPIFGYGSHQQGDSFGGTVLGVLDGIAWGSFILGFTPLGANYQWGTYFMLGSLSFLAGRVVGVIAPFAYTESQVSKQKSVSQERPEPGVQGLKAHWVF